MNDATERAVSDAAARTLVIGPLPKRLVAPASIELQPLSAADHLAVPTSAGQLRGALSGLGEAAFGAVVVTDWPRDAELLTLVRAVRGVVRGGGHLLFAAPLVQTGWRGARGAVVGLFRRRRPIALEALCGALLSARLTDIRARHVVGSDSLVYGTVPPGLFDPVESSTVRPT